MKFTAIIIKLTVRYGLSKMFDLVTRAEEMQADDEVAVAEIRNGLSFSDAMKKFTRI